MTKAEKAAYAALEAERDLYRSWRLTEAVEPDVSGKGQAIGYLVVGGGRFMRVEKASTCGLGHKFGVDAWEKRKSSYGWSPGTPDMYSTEYLALRQSRHLLCMEAARQLADLDRRIAEAQAEEEK